MDDCDYTVVSTNAHTNGTLIAQSAFLQNTKISTSPFNEPKAIEKDKKNDRPKGHVISLMEMIQILVLYGKLHTYIFYSYSNNVSRT